MRTWVSFTVGLALATNGCGPACLDDRCSLTPTSPQTTRVDYVNHPADAGAGTIVGSIPGDALPVAADAAAGSGSAAPPINAPPKSATWVALEGDHSKMYVSSTTPLPANTTIKFDFVRTPEKTPFVINLETKADGSSLPEAVWNDCSNGKIRCDTTGTKQHTTKRAGQILMAAGINWTLSDVNDQGGTTLITWTNNLSRELVTIRVSR